MRIHWASAAASPGQGTGSRPPDFIGGDMGAACPIWKFNADIRVSPVPVTNVADPRILEEPPVAPVVDEADRG